MEPILLQAVVAVLSVWIGAKFAGAEQANWGNALLAGLGTTATHWLAGSLAEGAQGGAALVYLAPTVINFFIIQWVYAASFGDTIMIILLTWVGRFIVALAAQAVLHESASAWDGCRVALSGLAQGYHRQIAAAGCCYNLLASPPQHSKRGTQKPEMPRTARRSFLQLIACALVGIAFAACSSDPLAQPETAKPNILFILVDDLGWADVGSFGSTLYETPNIDRLASQGMKFTNAYAACPVCSPTRASIMTGRYPVRQGITNYIRGDHRLPYSAVNPPKNVYQLALEEITIAEALKGAGYTTGHIGKWHLGDEGFLPQDQGFDYNYAGTRSGMPRSFFFPQWTGNPPVEAQEGEYLPDHLTDHALEFIESNQDKPFFLYLPFYAVHIPIEAKEEHIKKFEAKASPGLVPGKDQHNPIYAGMIYSVDENIGRLMDKLDELGIAGNTIIFFMSDNGGLNSPEWKNEPVTSNAPLRNGKGHLYEGGIREPLIIKWPGVTKPGSTSDVAVNSVDFFPTILGMAGAWQTRITSLRLDGVSLDPLLKQEATLEPRELYWHYPHYSNQLGRPGGAVRQGDLKLIEFYDDDSLELYNLQVDIGETNNLAEAMPDKAKELRGLLDAWRKSVGAKMPAPNPDYDPERADMRVRP